MKKNTLILLITILLFSCSKDSTTSESLTSKEKELLGKWYNDTFESTSGSMDMFCNTCYWEFFPAKGDDGVFKGVINDGAFFPWWTEQNGEIYIMLDIMVKVKSVTDRQLIIGIEGMTWTFYREGFQSKDTDDDGIKDSLDQCPNTPNGEWASQDGCSSSQKDTDGDGVKNNIDKCPNTPIGENVDSNGCSSSQKDSDNDGVKDNIDNCPSTPIGILVDSFGCPETKTYVPDDNFEKELIELGYDDVMDNYVFTSKISQVKHLSLYGPSNSAEKIRDLTGIQDFIALEIFYCVNNQITSLDLSKNIALVSLVCVENSITSLNVSKNTALETLSCFNNELTSLDVSNITNLKTLFSYGNQLTCIKVNQNQMNNIPPYNWIKDAKASYSASCN